MMPRIEGYCEEIISFLPDATFVIDLEGKVIAWNREMERMTKIPASSMLGRGEYEYAIPFYGDSRPMLANLILMPEAGVDSRYDSVARDGDTLVVDIYIPTFRQKGAYFWAKASPLYDPGGNVVGAIETIRDITDRVLAEKEREKMAQELSEIINFLPDATFVINGDGIVIAWNKAMESMSGVAAGDMLGRGEYEYAIPFYGDSRPMLANLILMPAAEVDSRYNSVARDGDTLVVDIYIPTFRQKGAYFWAKASPLYDPGGNVVGAIETIRDITDRVLAEKEREKMAKELSEIINFLPDATFVINGDGIVIAWNKAMESMSGVAAGDMLGREEYEYAIPFYGDRRPMLANLILMPAAEVDSRYDSVTRDGDTLVVDIYIPTFRQKGAYFWAKASPLYDQNGTITGAIETIRDITDRRRLEKRLARSKAELEIAAEIQQSFLPDSIPVVTGFDIAARSLMAREVGGDFFDVIPFELHPLQSGSFGILIADVSGKGVPAALFMALSRIVVRVNALWYHDPSKVIQSANEIICQDSRAGMFVTLFYGILSEKNRSMTYVNAGHNPPLLYRHITGTFEELTATGIVVGAVEDADFLFETVQIGEDDIIVLYTDGVTESINADDEMYGITRLESTIRNHASLLAAEILDAVLVDVLDFCGSQPQFDDITLLVIKG